MTKHEINPTLFDVAAWRLRGDQEKTAFVPQGATDPAAAMGGAPPMDPMAAGGMPPGGMPPIDPLAGAAGGMPPGGAPPMDPMAAMGGMPPGMAPAAPAAGAPGAPAAGGKPKIDPTFIYMELSRVRKLLTHMMKHTGIEMPPDILDDGAVAMVAQGQMPQSSPLGQGGPAEQGGGGLPGIGGSGPISPVEPAGGTEKPASDVMALFRAPVDIEKPDFDGCSHRIDALATLARSLGK